MTISIKCQVSAPVGLALEVIETDRGVETHRRRVAQSDDLCVWGSKTLILREVREGEAVAPAPGEQRHGSLDPAAGVKESAALERDTQISELQDALDKQTLRADDLSRQLANANARVDELKVELQKITNGEPAPGPQMSQQETDSRLKVVATIAETAAKAIEAGDVYYDDDVVLRLSFNSIVEICTLPYGQLPVEVQAEIQKQLDAAKAHA